MTLNTLISYSAAYPVSGVYCRTVLRGLVRSDKNKITVICWQFIPMDTEGDRMKVRPLIVVLLNLAHRMYLSSGSPTDKNLLCAGPASRTSQTSAQAHSSQVRILIGKTNRQSVPA